MLERTLIGCILCLVLASTLHAAEADLGIRDVEVALTLLDVEDVNSTAQSFTANLAVAISWQDRSMAHDGPGFVSRSLEEIWYPGIQFLNQRRLAATFPKVAEISPDGNVVYRQRYWGSFSQPLKLESFPFDSQRLTVTLANVGVGMKSIRLTPSPASGISDQFSMPDWEVLGWDFVNVDLPFEADATQVRGMEFSLDVRRDTYYFWYKVIMPLVLIVLMSWMVFWIDPSLVASQISVSVTAMLTMIAYRFALAGYVPRLGFLTSLDIFVLVSTLAVFIAMLEVVLTAYLATNDRLETARGIDRHARWAVPLVYLLLASDALFFGVVFG